jgi:PAX-interacting protein 1
VLQPADTRTLNQKKMGLPLQQQQQQQQQHQQHQQQQHLPSRSVQQPQLATPPPVVRPAFDFASMVYGDELQLLQEQQKQQLQPQQNQIILPQENQILLQQQLEHALIGDDDDFGGFQEASANPSDGCGGDAGHHAHAAEVADVAAASAVSAAPIRGPSAAACENDTLRPHPAPSARHGQVDRGSLTAGYVTLHQQQQHHYEQQQQQQQQQQMPLSLLDGPSVLPPNWEKRLDQTSGRW